MAGETLWPGYLYHKENNVRVMATISPSNLGRQWNSPFSIVAKRDDYAMA